MNIIDFILAASNFGNATNFTVPPAQQNQLYSLTLPGDMLENYFNLASISAWQVRWGDGTFSGMGVSPGDSADVTASHIYSNTDTGGYQLAIVAYGMDDDGNDVSYILPHQDVAVAPDAPTDLGVMESAPGAINLTWNDDDSFVTSYVATATPTAGGTTITHNLSGTATSTSFTGLNTSASYTFTVTATNTLSDGIAASSATTTLAAAPPTGLTATAFSPNEIDLAWTNNSASAEQNEILISTDGTTFNYFDSVVGSQSSYQAKGLSPDTYYAFEVFPADENRAQSLPSNTAAGNTLIDTWNVQATGNSTVGEGAEYQLSLSASPLASAPAFDHWTVDWGDGSAPSIYTAEDVAATHVFLTGIDSAIVDVSASTASGATVPLTVAANSLEVDFIPTAPTNFQAVPYSPTEIDLNWTDNSNDADGYSISRSIDNGVSFEKITEVAGTASSYSDTTLGAGSTAEYFMQATGIGGQNNSNTSSAPSLSTIAITTPMVSSDGTPTLSVVPATNGSSSAVVTWTYQGSDDSGFELEMEDASTSENFHLILNAGKVGPSGLDHTTVSLISGDTYYFRIRADHTNGTASQYVEKSIAIGAVSSPELSVENIPFGALYDGTITYACRVGWSGAPSNGSIQLQVVGYAFAGPLWRDIIFTQGVHGAWPVDFHGSENGWDVGQFLSDGLQGYVMFPEQYAVGAYSYRIRSFDSSGNPTAWSMPESFSVTNGPNDPSSPVALGISLSPTNTTITANWSVLADPKELIEENVFIQAGNQPGYAVGVGIPISSYSRYLSGTGSYDTNASPTSLSFTTTFTGLTPGVTYYICIWTTGTEYLEDPANPSPANSSTNTNGGTSMTPDAPADLRVVALGDGISNFKEELIWQNIPNNEDGYIIQRSTSSSFTNVSQFRTGPDETNYIDTLPNPTATYYYRVAAYRGNSDSAFIGGSATPSHSPVALAISWFPLTNPDEDTPEGKSLLPLGNKPPPSSFLTPSGNYDPTAFAKYVFGLDYRNIAQLQVGFTIDPYTGVLTVNPKPNDYPGYTPVPIASTPLPIPGQRESSLDISYNLGRTLATVTYKVKFRLNPIEQPSVFVLGSLSGHGFHGAAWAWATITYKIDDGGGTYITFSGSAVPNQSDYVDGAGVGGYDLNDNPDGFDAFLDAPYGSPGPVDNR